MTQPTPTPSPGDPAPAPTPTPPQPPAPTPPPPTPDEPLGPAGKRALEAEREARKALEKQVSELAPLRKLAEMLGAGTPAANGKSEIELLTERFTAHEKTVAEERAARWRAEVANEKGLPPSLAARLRGETREEMAADADTLKALLPPEGPRTPAPDPSQGARGGQPADLDAQIREAQAKRDWRTVISLQNSKLAKKT
jgi:hypothetical protein